MRKHMLLAEMFSLHTLLLENRVEFLQKNMLPRLEKVVERLFGEAPPPIANAVMEKPGETLAEKVFGLVLDFDPDRTKKFSQWLLTMLIKDKMKLEDLQNAGHLLAQFVAARNALPPEHKDINRFKTPGDLAAVLASLEGQDVRSEREKDRELEQKMLAQAEVVFNDNDYRILVPKTEEASCYFGVNTQWCTAATRSNNMFDYYNKQGPLYIVLHKPSNTRWQFQFETGSFMDELDRKINLQAFIEQHPKVAAFFEERDANMEVIGELFDNVGGQRYTAWRDENGTVSIRPGDETARGLLARKPIATMVVEGGTLQAPAPGSLGRFGKNRRGSPNFGWPYKVSEDTTFIERLVTLFRTIGVPPSDELASMLAGLGVFYNGKYGTLPEVGKRVITDEALAWYQITRAAKTIYGLYKNGFLLMAAEVEDGAITLDVKYNNQNEAVSGITRALLLRDPQIKSIDASGNYRSPNLTAEDAALVIEKKPSLATSALMLKAKGSNDPDFRAVLEKELDEVEAQHKGLTDQGVVIRQFTNLEEFVDEHGNDIAQRIMNVRSGGDRFERDDTYYDNDLREMLLRSLSAEDLKKVGEYMQAEHEEAIEEMKESDDFEFDPTNVDSILELHAEVDDDQLESAFRSASLTGEEIGAENEMYRAFKKAVETHGMLYFFKDGNWTRELNYDTQVAVVVPYEVMVVMLENEDDRDAIRDDDYSFLDDITLEVQEPYYGWSGFDDYSAKERFGEDIHEFVD